MYDFRTEAIDDLQTFKGVPFPASIKFRQLLVTGPPGAGKSTIIRRIGGWSEEGYLDLSQKRWWSNQALAIRPREIHLGLPFRGFDQGLAVFDDAWLATNPHPELEPERILLPPPKRHWFSVDWLARFVFELILPPPEQIFRQRAERARRGTHPVDANLTLPLVKAQAEVFCRTAEYLHRRGVSVYIRPGTDAQPRRFARQET